MTNIQEELKFTKHLLRLEWKEDLEQFRQKTQSKSIQERKEAGTCWYPVQLIKVKSGLADKLIVEIICPEKLQSHGFQSGKTVAFFSNDKFTGKLRAGLNGVINTVRGNYMAITLPTERLPEWMTEGKLGVDLMFDESTYKQMDQALSTVMKTEEGRLGKLKAILLGEEEAGFDSSISHHPDPTLNPSQNEALYKVAAAKEVAFIHGPPGTGKTTTLVAAISSCLKRFHQVLVCGPSNASVDLLVEKLVEKGICTLRIGHPARVDDDILSQTLDAKTSNHPVYQDLKSLRKKADQLKTQAKKYKRSFGPGERRQREKAWEQVRLIKEEIRQLEEYLQMDIYQNTQVFACTLSGAGSPPLKGLRFPIVFIDEAAQGLEPATWIPVLSADKVVMAGDHCQLPPTIKSFEAASKGLKETLFEKTISRQPLVSKMLLTQYRMPSLIMGFSSRQFYHNRLEAAPSTFSHALAEDQPVLQFIDTAGSGFQEHTDKETLSTMNLEEARFASSILVEVIAAVGPQVFVNNQWTIGLISPYRAQVETLKELMEEKDFKSAIAPVNEFLSIDTIDGFQGQERDLVIISLVRSNAEGVIGFLSDTRRMNVALTRAKRKLIVIGDSSTLGNHPFYKELIAYMEENQSYSSIYEWIAY